MSQRDINRNRAALEAFMGRLCFATLAANSIRLRLDDQIRRVYIWIDPPWVFSRDLQEITSSNAYSEKSFREWCKLCDPLRETLLENFNEEENGSVTLIFRDGYRLFLPTDLESYEQPGSDYDHWYVYDETG